MFESHYFLHRFSSLQSTFRDPDEFHPSGEDMVLTLKYTWPQSRCEMSGPHGGGTPGVPGTFNVSFLPSSITQQDKFTADLLMALPDHARAYEFSVYMGARRGTYVHHSRLVRRALRHWLERGFHSFVDLCRTFYSDPGNLEHVPVGACLFAMTQPKCKMFSQASDSDSEEGGASRSEDGDDGDDDDDDDDDDSSSSKAWSLSV